MAPEPARAMQVRPPAVVRVTVLSLEHERSLGCGVAPAREARAARTDHCVGGPDFPSSRIGRARVRTNSAPAGVLDALAALDGLSESAMGPRTRLVLLTHPSNRTGQLLPARRIADAAHRVGAEAVVDGAQSLGVLEDPVQSLGCDYYGASGHKWLGLPVGVGVLWMRPAHVSKVWPLVASGRGEAGMGRFEWIGTAPEYVGPAALPALTLHRALGAARKAERLRYLARYWRTRVEGALPDARFLTNGDPAMSCALCTLDVPGLEPRALQRRLRERDGILVQAVSSASAGGSCAPELRGVRVSPNVYTTPPELERFVGAVVGAARASRR
jgi:isopenicillin-N epimerase